MKAIVVYDSLYGNTEKIAKHIGKAIGPDTPVVAVKDAWSEDLRDVDLLIIGSPTHAGHPTPDIQEFITNIGPGDLESLEVAAFDTRVGAMFAKVFGFAANRIGHSFEKAGKNLIVPPKGFIVLGKEGPLAEGELEHSGNWAKLIVETKMRQPLARAF